MRAAALCLMFAACLPEYEEEAPACAPTEIAVHLSDHVWDCAPRPLPCAVPATCLDGACGLAVLALCGDATEAAAACGDEGIVTEVICGR
jgi:hypothetical protein